MHLATLAENLSEQGAVARPALAAALEALAASLGCDAGSSQLTDAHAKLLCRILTLHAGAPQSAACTP